MVNGLLLHMTNKSYCHSQLERSVDVTIRIASYHLAFCNSWLFSHLFVPAGLCQACLEKHVFRDLARVNLSLSQRSFAACAFAHKSCALTRPHFTCGPRVVVVLLPLHRRSIFLLLLIRSFLQMKICASGDLWKRTLKTPWFGSAT